MDSLQHFGEPKQKTNEKTKWKLDEFHPQDQIKVKKSIEKIIERNNQTKRFQGDIAIVCEPLKRIFNSIVFNKINVVFFTLLIDGSTTLTISMMVPPRFLYTLAGSVTSLSRVYLLEGDDHL